MVKTKRKQKGGYCCNYESKVSSPYANAGQKVCNRVYYHPETQGHDVLVCVHSVKIVSSMVFEHL